MLIRVRSNVGVWRVDVGDERTATVSDVVEGVQRTRPGVSYLCPLSFDPACKEPLDTTRTLSEQGLQHGSMVHCRVDPSSCADVVLSSSSATADDNRGGDGGEDGKRPAESSPAPSSDGQQPANKNMRRVIDKDGRIKLVPSSEPGGGSDQDRGFRKGMLPLRDMKMQWTLNDFIALDSQFEFKMQRQEAAVCKQVSLDVPSINGFQSYMQTFQFRRKRFGFLYGTFEKEEDGDEKPSKVRVEAIYEPPQEVDPEAAEGFVPLDDPKEAVVDQIASLLGLTKVGWIFGHEPREDGFVMSSAEVIMAAEFQLEAAGGVEETPFVTVKVFPKSNGTVSVEAFQVSQQCMAMVAEEALEIGPDPKFCNVNETFTAIQEGKPSKTVENNFFLTVVPIAQHTSENLIAEFPRANRDVDNRVPTHDEMKKQLQKSGTAGWTFEDRLADFNLLVYLSDFLDLNADFPKICSSLADRKNNAQGLDDGYKLIIKSMAGMEGSY